MLRKLIFCSWARMKKHHIAAGVLFLQLAFVANANASDMADIGVAFFLLILWGILLTLQLIIYAFIATKRCRADHSKAGLFYLLVPLMTILLVSVTFEIYAPGREVTNSSFAFIIPFPSWLVSHWLIGRIYNFYRS